MVRNIGIKVGLCVHFNIKLYKNKFKQNFCININFNRTKQIYKLTYIKIANNIPFT